MIRKLIIAITVLITLAVGGYLLVPDERDEAAGLTAAIIDNAPPTPSRELSTDALRNVPLSTANTTITFSCAKTIAGKTMVVRGGWSQRFDSIIEGTLKIDVQSGQPTSVTARIRIDSLWSEHDQLTEALLTMGFFQPDTHPWATFNGTVQHIGNPNENTATITGEFELNGVTRTLELPVTMEGHGDVVVINSAFSLDRTAFNVHFTESGTYGLLTDADISHDVAVTLRIEIPRTEAPTVNLAGSPRDDFVELPSQSRGEMNADLEPFFTETISFTQVQFDMVLVPGDPEAGIEPFYIGRHEVAWDEFMPWVQGEDLADDSQMAEARALKLRPSAPYGSVDRNFGMYRRPALGMSRMAAQLYCRWLSEQTGRHYRLPTEAEWERAYAAGGGNLTAAPDIVLADRIATHHGNAWNDDIGDWATTRVGSREPDTLGIHDMAGNVAEWVTDTGGESVVRGGHFEAPASELGVGRVIEDMDLWNRDYPNEPKSQWWYVNARWVGFRVVCEPKHALIW